MRCFQVCSALLTLTVLSLVPVAHAQTQGPAIKLPAIEWLTDPAVAQERAMKLDRPLLVFASAEWCAYCQQMKRDVWTDPAVIREVREKFVPLYLDADKYPHEVARLRVEAFPTTLVLSPMKPRPESLVGYVPASRLLPFLHQASAIKSKLPAVAHR